MLNFHSEKYTNLQCCKWNVSSCARSIQWSCNKNEFLCIENIADIMGHNQIMKVQNEIYFIKTFHRFLSEIQEIKNEIFS